MAATAQNELSMGELKMEIQRLNRELDLANGEAIQSAQLGLALLEEKKALQQRCDEFEKLYENTKHDFYITREALRKVEFMQKVTTQSAIDEESDHLKELVAVQSSCRLRIVELEGASKKVRHELERVIHERDRLLAESCELDVDKATWEAERAALCAELREVRQREQRVLMDVGDLDKNNQILQNEVSALRSSQMKTEEIDNQIRQLREEVEAARAAAVEATAQRCIAENELSEALGILQFEREAKLAAKELDRSDISNMACQASRSELQAADHHADLFSEVQASGNREGAAGLAQTDSRAACRHDLTEELLKMAVRQKFMKDSKSGGSRRRSRDP